MMPAATPGFHHPAKYPYEAFVQEALRAHFTEQGYFIEQMDSVDLVCRHPESGERWVIEAKGKTTQPGLDFRTALGQIVTAMHDQTARYAVAIPALQPYHRLCGGISAEVRDVLRLHWMIVAASGLVTCIAPGEEIAASMFGAELTP